MGEFGEERRNLTPIREIPQVMKDAVLSIEDSRFYQHGGLDYLGLIRAGIANLSKRKSQGASTITMQVARNVYLSTEKTYTRKIYEILLTYKLEHLLTKDQILEIYMNQIFLGNRAYGFASAAETYFGKSLKDITIAEAAKTCTFKAVVHHRADGRKQLHHRQTGLGSQGRAPAHPAQQRKKSNPRRVRG
jgi:penicillin-binding protein 1A